MSAPTKHTLGVFALAMMNVAAVMSLRGIPMMAREGWTMLFYILFASLFFLVPVSLVSAELATGWPREGGVYRWVKEAFGPKLGFTAIWLQWIQNVIWYPTVLAYAAGCLAYLFLDPALAENKYFNLLVILVVYWGATLVNLRGMKTAGWLTTAGVISGTLFPAALIIILGIGWLLGGNPLELARTSHSVLPDLDQPGAMSFLGSIVLLFAGMEVGAVHVTELKNPKAGYPKAVFLAMFIIMAVFTLGSFSLAAVLPVSQISLTSGIMQGFHDLLGQFGLDWLLPVIGFLAAFGAVGGVIAWLAGPSKGRLATSRDGDLPPFLQVVNKNGVQSHILFIQGIIVTVVSLVYVVMPNVSAAFFLLSALTATLYLIMYVMLYASAIKLRHSQPDVHRDYRVPGGDTGMWVVAGTGLVAVLFAMIVGFVPPANLAVGSPSFYVWFLAIGTIVFVAAPIIINHVKRPEWKNTSEDQD